MLHQIVFLSLLLSISNAQITTDSVALKPLSLSVIPARPHDAVTGSQFAKITTHITGKKLQAAALHELRRGNIPSFLRTLRPVMLTHVPEDGSPPVTVVIRVTPDYLAIGSDSDFLRIPLSYPSAASIASEFGCILPTRKIVDSVYRQSSFHYKPQSLPPCPMMRSIPYIFRHQCMIEKQWTGMHPGKLVSGHKKDVVLTNRLWEKPNRVAIYGWHMPDGEPIQGLSIFHGARYADYSHGIRLVHEIVLVNGTPCSIHEILKDPDLAPALTYEGSIRDTKRLMTRNQSVFRLAENRPN